MTTSRITAFCLAILMFGSVSDAQTPTEVLAIANGRNFTSQDLSPNIAKAWLQLPATLANAKKALLDRQIEALILETEASKRNLTIEKLLEIEVEKKVPDPAEEQVKNIYDANRKDIGDVPLSEVRPKIVEFLRREPEKRAYANYVKTLRGMYPMTPGKDVRQADLRAEEILVTVGGKPITAAGFNQKNGLVLYEYEANIYDQVLASLKQAVDAALYASEAQGIGIPTSEYVAREITNKMVNFSDAEQMRLQLLLRKRLYQKYRTRFFIKEPKPFVQSISIDDDPIRGNPDAPITVVMFTDFQCPACASVYPVLKGVMQEYGDKIRFVVRDYPLTELHENAFQAAVAANAAAAQNKFFEFKELLYKNQDSLDTESLIKLAKQAGLKEKRFTQDLKSKKFADEVRKDMKDGDSYGVSSTPTVFVNGIKVRILSAEGFRKTIDRFILE